MPAVEREDGPDTLSIRQMHEHRVGQIDVLVVVFLKDVLYANKIAAPKGKQHEFVPGNRL